ncbi:MAG: sigma-E processing peptidase SpoIIGA [Clostridia bacterium]
MYADVLWIVNLYVDYFILLAVKDLLNLNINLKRLILASVVGACFSLISLLNINTYFNLFISVIVAFIICLIAFYKKKLKFLIKPFACFFIISYIFSGIIFLISQYTTFAFLVGGTVYFQISPIVLFVFTVISFSIFKLLNIIKGNFDNKVNFCKIIIEKNGNKVELLAKIDTGNTLKEPFSNKPVIIAEKESLINLNMNKNENYRLIPFNTLGGNGLLPAITADKIYTKKDGIELNAFLALYDGKLSAGSFNCLLNPDIL